MCHDCQTSNGPFYTRLLQDGTSILVCGLCRCKSASGGLKRSAPSPSIRFTRLRPRLFVASN
jgi:hypothetical protein